MRSLPKMALLLAATLAGCDGASSDLPVTLPSPYIVLPAVEGRAGAGYFELRVPGTPGDLVSVTSPQIGRIEMHQTVRSGGVTSMRPLERVPIEDGGIVFSPRGRHLMLFDIDPSLKPDDQALLTLRFDGGTTRPLAFVVRAPGEGHAGH